MTTTLTSKPSVEPERRQRRRWSLAVAAVLAGAVIVAVVALSLLLHHAAGHPGFTPSVKASDWKPNPSYYCAGLSQLSEPGETALHIATVANAAPTAASRAAVVTYYNHVTHLDPTTGDIARITASYQCK